MIGLIEALWILFAFFVGALCGTFVLAFFVGAHSSNYPRCGGSLSLPRPEPPKDETSVPR